jgi:hypothetical protein
MRRRRILTAALVTALLLAVPVARSSGADNAERTVAVAGLGDSHAAAFDPRAARTADRIHNAGIIDLPVRFTVRNTNRSKVPCATDGGTYQVRGHLTAPRTTLAREVPTATLYLHGAGTGEWYWRNDVAGFHYTEELARRGQISVTIDRLGYGTSDQPNGYGLCVGGQADITHQIMLQLRSGQYATGGKVPAPAFDSVFLAGQDTGAQIAEITAYSFEDAAGLVLMSWADRGLASQANARFMSALATCMQTLGNDEEPRDPTGYAYLDVGRKPFIDNNFGDARPDVTDATRQSRTPCGEIGSRIEATVIDRRHTPGIAVPVLTVRGEFDAVLADGAKPDVFPAAATHDSFTVPGAGDFVALGSAAGQLHTAVTNWLGQH